MAYAALDVSIAGEDRNQLRDGRLADIHKVGKVLVAWRSTVGLDVSAYLAQSILLARTDGVAGWILSNGHAPSAWRKSLQNARRF